MNKNKSDISCPITKHQSFLALPHDQRQTPQMKGTRNVLQWGFLSSRGQHIYIQTRERGDSQVPRSGETLNWGQLGLLFLHRNFKKKKFNVHKCNIQLTRVYVLQEIREVDSQRRRKCRLLAEACSEEMLLRRHVAAARKIPIVQTAEGMKTKGCFFMPKATDTQSLGSVEKRNMTRLLTFFAPVFR